MPIEIIIINNNSTDNSQNLIDQYALVHPTLIKAIYESTPGANAARNAGLRIAKGEWIQLLDADDELMQNKFYHQIGLALMNPDVDIIYGNYRAYKFNNNSNCIDFVKNSYNEVNILNGLIDSSLGITSAILWKRLSLLIVGFFDKSKSSNQEYFLMLDLYAAGAIFLRDPEVNTKIYVDGDSISRTSDGPRSLQMLRTKLEYFESLVKVFREKKELTNELLSKINRKVRLSYSNNYYNYKEVCEAELLEIKSANDIHPTIVDKVLTHAHQVYSKYCPKKGIGKYFIFIYFFFAKIKNLIR